MEGLIQGVRDFLQKEDIFDTIILFLSERYELLITIFALIFIFVLSLSAILERLHKRGWIALVPIYRFVVLFKALGLKSWFAILMIIPGVNLIMRVVFYVALVRKFNRNYFFVPLLVLLPLVFLPIVAFGDGGYIHIDKRGKAYKKSLERQATTPKVSVAKDNPKIKESSTKPRVEDGFELEMEEMLYVNEKQKKQTRTLAKDMVSEKQIARPLTKAKPDHVEKTVKRAPNADNKMPTMKQGPMGKVAAERRANVESEYEKLLREQEVAQRRRLQQQKRNRDERPGSKRIVVK